MKNRRLIALLLCICTVLTLVAGAFSVQAEESNADYLELRKKANKIADGSYELELQAWATQTVTGTPTDVVMVLDQSGSMLHAANVDRNKLKPAKANNNTSIDLYIQDAMSWNKMLAEVESSDAIARGASHPGYYMMMNTTYSQPDYKEPANATYPNEAKIYALRYEPSTGKWYRYKSMGCADVLEGQVNQHIEATEVGEELRGTGYRDNLVVYKSVLGVSLDAMYSFLETVEGTDSLRIAMVGFAGPRGDENPYTGTGFFDGDEFHTIGKDFNYNFINSRHLFKATNDSTAMAELWESWGLYGAKRNNTATNLGFRMAQELFDRDCTNVNANRIIILFSDGAPTQSPDTIVERLKQGKSWDNNKDLTYIPEIYTIGPDSFHTDVTNLTKWATDAAHCFQPSISGLEEAFKKIAGEIVRKSASLGENTLMLDEITQTFTIPKALEDFLADSTKSDAEKAAEIKKYIKVYTAAASADASGTITYAERVPFPEAKVELKEGSSGLWNVEVSNFNYTNNAVTSLARENPDTGKIDFYGKKLIVTIPIVTVPGFLGGDIIDTNTGVSGIYDAEGKLVETFERPKVDEPVETITPMFQNDAIYVSQEADLPYIANIGRYQLEENGPVFTPDGIRNEYVNITYTITDNESGESMSATIPAGTYWHSEYDLTWTGTLTPEQVLLNDKQYTVKCEVKSVKVDSHKTEATGTPTIYVYKPHVTFKDSLLKYNAPSNYDGNNIPTLQHNDGTNVNVIWKHGDTVADVTTMGAAPTLTYSYSPENSNVQSERKVHVTKVTATSSNNMNHYVQDGIDIIGQTTFYRDDCTVCGHELGEVKDNACNFIVHLETFDLVINKVVNGKIDDGQSFLFNVEGPGFSGDVVISKFTYDGESNKTTGSVTVKGLTAGEYTIQELIDWSWRYKIVGDLEQTITSAEGNASVTFTNEREDTYWLSGETSFRNLFNSIDPNGQN